MQRLMVTGGAGFIGSNFVRYMLETYPEYFIVVYDKLTYAGRLENLEDVAERFDDRYAFVKGDICNATKVEETLHAYDVDTIVNFAAETHVDRSLMEPGSFIQTDVYGTFVLLEAAKALGLERYHQISSVTGDTPLLVRDERSGEIDLRPIETLSNESLDQFSVLTLTEDFEVTFRRMRHLISHEADELYEITFNGGGKVRATANHSIFVFEGGQIVTKPSSQLKEGDLLVTFVGDVEADEKSPHGFDLRALFADYDTEWMNESLTRRRKTLQALIGDKEASAIAQEIGAPTFYRITKELIDGGYLERENGVYNVTAQGVQNAWDSMEDIHWDLTRRQLHIPVATLEVTPLLMEVFGLYLAEGHASHTPAEIERHLRSVVFTIGKHEMDYLEKLTRCAREVLNIEPTIKERESSWQVQYSSYWVHALFTQFGATAESKRLPAWIWAQPKEYVEAFFRGYEGDARVREDGQRHYTTINHDLAKELIWLARFNDINCRLSRRVTKQIAGQKPPNVTVNRQRVCWDIAISAENYHPDQKARWRTPMARCLPTDHVAQAMGLRQHRYVKLGYKQLVGKNRARTFLDTFEEVPVEVQTLVNSPIGVAKVKSIQRITGVFTVYDVSVPGCERFFGGNVPCLLHNTDEVYGQVLTGRSTERDHLEPRSPYSASKTSGDLMTLAYFESWQLPVTITRGSNNVGPYQYPEKVVPLFATNALDDQPLPVYGDGLQMRDYQYVVDHCEGIDVVLHKGELGEIYNVGTGEEITNMAMTEIVLETLGKPRSLIKHVEDRAGHDRRYALDVSKLQALGWESRHSCAEAVAKTVRWYAENEGWWRPIKSGNLYQAYYRQQYGKRMKDTE